ncbi:MAG: DUF1566 domain-containing protein [Bacteroidales bacterium]|nr:DUF1566 domain-containing protein [Bacteroidales bacterium]
MKQQEILPKLVEDESGNGIGIYIPVINKTIYFRDCPEKRMSWRDAMAYAESIGRSLPSLRECYILMYFKDEINAIAKKAGYPDFLSGPAWSSTEYNGGYAWGMNFASGGVGISYKYNAFTVRPVAA